ncbi:hypothetical protein BLOT_001514 [Blomia tropicalis]|nr:hypothetical protein BLOT_001514 [Blomia tropicalis]
MNLVVQRTAYCSSTDTDKSNSDNDNESSDSKLLIWKLEPYRVNVDQALQLNIKIGIVFLLNMETSTIVRMHQSDSSLETTNEIEVARKRQRTCITYDTIKTFEDLVEAKRYIKDKKLWHYKGISNSYEGTKHLYTCKTSTKCPARICLWIPATSNDVFLQATKEEHDHEIAKRYEIAPKTKDVIKQLISNGITKPKSIQSSLRDQEIVCPETSQLNNYLVRLRREEGSPILSLGELEEHILSSLRENSTFHEETPRVINYFVDYEAKTFGIFWSSSLLLSFMDKSASINIDATYKLNYLGFPVFVTGTTDKQQRFHPFGIALLQNEDTASFKFVFESLKKANSTYQPTILVAGSAPAITSAFEEVFGTNYTRVYCWFHVKKNIDQKLKSIKKELKEKIQADIYKLQLATSPIIFQGASKYFLTKWRKYEEAQSFIKYFENEYLLQRNNWFEGAATGFPSTNNSLEATISMIKKEFTLRERLPLDKFFKTAGLIIKRWSQERNHADPSAKKFQETPETSVLLQKEAYSLSKSDIEVREKTINGNKFCFIPSTSSSHKPIREEEITNYFKKTENPKFRTFENYINFTTRMWVVNYNEEWQTSTFSKNR